MELKTNLLRCSNSVSGLTTAQHLQENSLGKALVSLSNPFGLIHPPLGNETSYLRLPCIKFPRQFGLTTSPS